MSATVRALSADTCARACGAVLPRRIKDLASAPRWHDACYCVGESRNRPRRPMSQSTDNLSMLTAAAVAVAALGRIGSVVGALPASVVTHAPAARCAAAAPLSPPATLLVLHLASRARK
jgi:hypothetical protein